MRVIALALLLGWSSAAAAVPPPTEHVDCAAAIATAERVGDIPAGLLAAIARIESGRADPAGDAVRPWPWTIDAHGEGRFLATKAEAVAATEALQAQGVASIDVGCMQVNLAFHPAAFAGLDEAFDPLANALYAARFLRLLFGETGDWGAAVAAYHSQTAAIGAAYSEQVLAAWTPAGPVLPPAADPRGSGAPDRIAGTGSDRHRRSALEGKLSLPERSTPTLASPWIERVIGSLADCSAMAVAAAVSAVAPEASARSWNKPVVVCPTSPFANPAALRRLLREPRSSGSAADRPEP